MKVVLALQWLASPLRNIRDLLVYSHNQVKKLEILGMMMPKFRRNNISLTNDKGYVLTKNFSKNASTFDSETSPSKNSSAIFSLSCSTSVLEICNIIIVSNQYMARK